MTHEEALKLVVNTLHNQPELLEEVEFWQPISALLTGDEGYYKPISISELDNRVWRNRSARRR